MSSNADPDRGSSKKSMPKTQTRSLEEWMTLPIIGSLKFPEGIRHVIHCDAASRRAERNLEVSPTGKHNEIWRRFCSSRYSMCPSVSLSHCMCHFSVCDQACHLRVTADFHRLTLLMCTVRGKRQSCQQLGTSSHTFFLPPSTTLPAGLPGSVVLLTRGGTYAQPHNNNPQPLLNHSTIAHPTTPQNLPPTTLTTPQLPTWPFAHCTLPPFFLSSHPPWCSQLFPSVDVIRRLPKLL